MDITPFAVNQFIPHPMMVFAASTYNKDESPHLALVSWVNFYWDDGLGVTLCMDGDKAVKRNFEREGALVLNALSRDMFDAVEALGRASGGGKGQGHRTLRPRGCRARACAPAVREPSAL